MSQEMLYEVLSNRLNPTVVSPSVVMCACVLREHDRIVYSRVKSLAPAILAYFAGGSLPLGLR